MNSTIFEASVRCLFVVISYTIIVGETYQTTFECNKKSIWLLFWLFYVLFTMLIINLLTNIVNKGLDSIYCKCLV